MVITLSQMGDLELPDLPPNQRLESNIIRPDQFTRKKLKVILHLITAELKLRGTKTPHIFLPFRSKIDDAKLELFLQLIFPDGELLNLKDEDGVKLILKATDEFTLICGLKYLWSRLPNHEIIGWSVYLEYRRKEKEAGYPKSAFLSILPKCLSSPAHASIVYDFLDLLISITSNSQYNYLSGRKIAKMSSLWAFNGTSRFRSSPFYDATIKKENNFNDGLETWKSSSDALFHLLLSFLRAMLPDKELETLKLPKTLQSLLITNSYPPMENNDSLKSMITIPCVNISSTKPSNNPYELLSKVRHTLSFEKKDSFLSIENYTILKNIFQKESTNDIVATLTEESRRILNRLTTDPISSDYDLYPGWVNRECTNETPVDPNIPLYSAISITNITIQDYYIWTWLSSIGSDQTSHIKKLFGRSLVLEAGLRGFQKWLIVTEKTLSTEEYVAHFNNGDVSSRRVVSNDSYAKKDTPLPPPPPPEKDTKGLLPKINFSEHDSRLDVSIDEVSGHIRSENTKEELSDYQTYINSLDDHHGSEIGKPQTSSTTSSQMRTSGRRPPPPPMETEAPGAQHQQYDQAYSQQSYTQPTYSDLAYDQPGTNTQTTYNQPMYQLAPQQNGNNVNANYDPNAPAPPAPLPVSNENLNSPSLVADKSAFVPEKSPGAQSQYLTPDQHSPQRNSIATQFYSPSKDGFHEPYELYVTAYEKAELAKQNQSDEPFDNYQVPGQPEQTYPTEQVQNHEQVQQANPAVIHEQTQQGYIAQPEDQPTYEVAQDMTYADYGPTETEQIPQHQVHQEEYFAQAPQDPQYLTGQEVYQDQTVSPGQQSPNPNEDETEEAKKAKEEKRKKRKEKKKKEKEMEQEKEMAALTAAMAYGFFPPPGGMMPPFGTDGLPPIPPPGFFPMPPGLEPESPKKKDKKKKKKKSEASGEKSPAKSLQLSPETKQNPTFSAQTEVSPVPLQLPSPTVSMSPVGREEQRRSHPGPIPATVSMIPPSAHAPAHLGVPLVLQVPQTTVATTASTSAQAPAPAPSSARQQVNQAHVSPPNPPQKVQLAVPQDYDHIVPKLSLPPAAPVSKPQPQPLQEVVTGPRQPPQVQHAQGVQASQAGYPDRGGHSPETGQPVPTIQAQRQTQMPTVTTLAPPRSQPLKSPLVKSNEAFALPAPAPILRARGLESSESLANPPSAPPKPTTYQPQPQIPPPAAQTQSRSPMLNQRLDASLPSLPLVESGRSPHSGQTSPQSNHSYQHRGQSLPPTPNSQVSHASTHSAPHPTHTVGPQGHRTLAPNQRPPQPYGSQPGSQTHLPRPNPSSAQPSPQPNLYAQHPKGHAQQQPPQPNVQAPHGHVQGHPPQGHPPQAHQPQGHTPQPSPQPNVHAQPPPPQGHSHPPPQGHPPQHYPPAQPYPQAPPQGYPSYPPPQGYPNYPPPQGYPNYPPPQGYDPNYYPPPPPGGYYPPQPYYPPPGGHHHPPAHSRQPPKQTTSDVAMRGMPSANKFNKNKNNNKANLRAAFNQGSFGI
ncbi:DUF1708-domain-containing protein [Suhomyces tanzawaensis NRRL Y-17324]|uniref:DUF1708-domain-containing protein n=1 Tax=Suhomyces tanzawaensis NRRL Y-17324 TaxID=984487 RepID=A0A1E4SMR9_9ASCO|nr:DUF1708-domain-containing protein [Suhomyces tanzawaensis NRRL Y-17324]ODV80786.1 DUF1708-domain-containing protein [Suhomyces tanzawaensis NRRL Y-17324]